MAADPPLSSNDLDVDALACEFLGSRYASPVYADWSPDRRIDTFLRRRGLSRVADNGDLSNFVLDRVLAHVGVGPDTRRF